MSSLIDVIVPVGLPVSGDHVSRAGGLGVLGALAFSPEQLQIELAWIDEHVDGKPYGVDVVMPATPVGNDDTRRIGPPSTGIV